MIVPLDLGRLRKAVGTVAAHVDSGDHVWTEAVVMAEALSPLLTLAESGGRLVVETPCEHGDWDEWPHYTDEGRCSGASRHVVWPKEEEA